MMRRSFTTVSTVKKAQPLALALLLGLVLMAAPAAGVVINVGQTVDEGTETEVPCNTTTTTTLPPVVGVALVDPPPAGAVAEDPCPPAEEEEPAPVAETTTTTTAARSQINAVDDTIEATQDRELTSFDVTDNDSISPSLGRMSIVSGEMPDGLQLWVDNSLEGWVIGTPTECGTFAVEYTIEASGTVEDPPSDTATVTVEVACNDDSAPLEAGDDEIDGQEGERVEVDLVENDSPSAGIAYISFESGDLPRGLTVWAGGWLTGTPAETGDFEFTYSIRGRDGQSESATVTLTIE